MIHKVTQSIATDAGSGTTRPISGTRNEYGTVYVSIDQTYGVVTDEDLPVAWTAANLRSAFLVADRDMTIKVNSSGSPEATIALKAGSPLAWNKSDGYFDYPFGAGSAVSHLYLTTTVGTRLQILALASS